MRFIRSEVVIYSSVTHGSIGVFLVVGNNDWDVLTTGFLECVMSSELLHW